MFRGSVDSTSFRQVLRSLQRHRKRERERDGWNFNTKSVQKRLRNSVNLDVVRDSIHMKSPYCLPLYLPPVEQPKAKTKAHRMCMLHLEFHRVK